jgi:cysteinyl-tRNA synthetase
MTLSLYNTLTRRKEPFRPLDPANVRMYVCGPTVYDDIHIGNARPLVVFDVLARLLRHQYGASHVTYARNITDVDDKIIDRAAARGIAIDDLTGTTTARFHEDAAALGCLPPDVEPRATAHIAEMIALVERLIAKGHAYATGHGEVLFDVPSMPDYGRLSGRNRDEMIAGARVEVASHKRDPADFVLWKPSTADQPGWDSPWGRGRPGWHLECSAMSEKYLGPEFDIHGGGVDLVFPHHENEIAQSVCDHPEHPFARVWVHNGYLMSEGEKMSKSLGNFYTVRELLEEFSAEWGYEPKARDALRLILLKTHYRQPLNFTKDGVREAKRELDALYRPIYDARRDGVEPSSTRDEAKPVVEALSDDLNTPLAITRLRSLASDLNIANKVRPPVARAKQLGKLLANGLMLGLLQSDAKAWFTHISGTGRWEVPISVSMHGGGSVATGYGKEQINELIEKRTEARRTKDFAEADRIRDELAEHGIVLEDGPGGTTWRRAG